MKSQLMLTLLCFVIVLAAANAQNWSPCSKSCGGGSQSRQSCFWGGICSSIFRACNTQECVSGWGVWQPCSKSCGGGTTFIMYKCPSASFKDCPKTYADCNTKKCKPLVNGCQTGYRFRYEDPSTCCKIVKEKCGEDAASAKRIVGGKKAAQGAWPWVAGLVRRQPVAKADGSGTERIIHCGGSILNKFWIVTAAHCFDPVVDSYVLLGSVTINSEAKGFQKREIADYKMHGQYSYPKNDIALVKVDKEIKFGTNIQAICLPTGEMVQQDTHCVVAGWGLTSPTNKKSWSNHLMQVTQRTLPLNACIQGYKNIRDRIWMDVTKGQHLCAGILKGDKDSCNGDSGGPLMCQRCSTCGWYLAGTVSFGADVCARSGVPATYMDVYHYQTWIRKYVSLSSKDYFVC